MTLEKMTKDERSLLLFLESRAVDNRGRVKTDHMNELDMEIAERWNREGFVSFGCIASEGLNTFGSHWCYLSDEAWILAAAERDVEANHGRTVASPHRPDKALLLKELGAK